MLKTTIDYRSKLDRLLIESAQAAKTVKSEKTALQKAKVELETLAASQQLLQSVAEQVQYAAHQQVASVVSRCLEAVFGDTAYALKIDFLKKRGKTEAKILLCRDGLEIEPLDAAGGGACDVASFALRLAALVLARPRRRRFLALDEPFKHLSAEYIPAVRTMLETLSIELGVQMLVITHSKALCVGKIVELN